MVSSWSDEVWWKELSYARSQFLMFTFRIVLYSLPIESIKAHEKLIWNKVNWKYLEKLI